MKISGFTKCSFVDYPGKLAATLFVPRCNMNCYYCHNRWLLAAQGDNFSPEDVLQTLRNRRGRIEGVVISGGEPTLQEDLERFILDLRELGYPVKLDTNGTRPDVLTGLIRHGLVDYVAMDVKAPPEKYEALCGLGDGAAGKSIDIQAIDASIRLLLEGCVDYEFRTTVAPELAGEDLKRIARWIRGAERYVLQQYRPLSADFFGAVECLSPPPHAPETILEWADAIRDSVRALDTRGIDKSLVLQRQKVRILAAASASVAPPAPTPAYAPQREWDAVAV